MKKIGFLIFGVLLLLFSIDSRCLAADTKYVGLRKSHQYHYLSCKRAQGIDPRNLITFKSAREAQKAGYVPCKLCKPPIEDRADMAHSQLLLLILILSLAKKSHIAVCAPTDATISPFRIAGVSKTFPTIITQRDKRAPPQEVFPEKGKNAHLKGRGEVSRGSK